MCFLKPKITAIMILTLGWYIGPSNRLGRMSGENIIYLYPDFHLALQGKWRHDAMQGAKFAKVIGVSNTDDGLLLPLVKQDDCDHVFTSDVSGYSVISHSPLVPDPYESQLVECRVSNLEDGGEGLFAKKMIPMGKIVAFYNGIRFHDCHVSYNTF